MKGTKEIGRWKTDWLDQQQYLRQVQHHHQSSLSMLCLVLFKENKLRVVCQ
jgi:hypothetical protein